MGRIVRNCRLCKMPMETSPFTMCATCLAESGKIQHYLSKNPYVSIEKISLETNVPYAKVKNLVALGLKNKVH